MNWLAAQKATEPQIEVDSGTPRPPHTRAHLTYLPVVALEVGVKECCLAALKRLLLLLRLR